VWCVLQKLPLNISKAQHQHFMVRFEDLMASGPAILRYILNSCINYKKIIVSEKTFERRSGEKKLSTKLPRKKMHLEFLINQWTKSTDFQRPKLYPNIKLFCERNNENISISLTWKKKILFNNFPEKKIFQPPPKKKHSSPRLKKQNFFNM
jgi:hypothetical protein